MSIESARLSRPAPAASRRARHAGLLCAVLALATLGAPAVLRAQTVRSDLAMTNGMVNAELVAGGKLYIGGSFTNVGQATGCGVPVDLASGQVVSGFPMVTGAIQAVVPDGTGGWFIGGAFTTVGGEKRHNLAHVLADLSVAAWDPAPDQSVYCLGLQGGVVYAGGDFLTIGGASRARIAALDSLTGLALAWNPGADGSVRALAASDSVLYAGGNFATIGGMARARLAALDLASGAVSPWSPGANGTVFALAAGNGVVYAGGFFSSLHGQLRVDLGAIDAATGLPTTWNPQADNQVLALAVNGPRVYVGGAFTRFGSVARSRIAVLDTGTALPVASWNPGAGGRVLALSVNGSVIHAGGEFTSIGGQPRTYVAALDSASGLATGWNPSAYGPVLALAPGGGALYVAGSFNGIGGAIRRSLAEIDLASGAVTSWDPGTDGAVLSLASHSGAILAGGQFLSAGGQPRNNLAAIDAATGLATPWNPAADGGVWALAVSGNTVYAGGTFSTIGGQARNNLGAVDAVSGLASGWNPNVNGQVFTILPVGGAIYFGGSFLTVGGLTRRNIAAVDTTSGAATGWHPNTNGTVRALAPACGSLYVGGFFTTVAGKTRNRIALLDPTDGSAGAWNPDANGPVFALALHDGALYASGLFGSIGGQARSRLASLDPTTGTATAWNPGSDNLVQVFAADGGTIYGGGGFATVGGASVSFLAGIQADASLSCPTIAISPPSLPPGTVGVAYGQPLIALGGTPPYCYAVTSGALPPGVALDPASAELSGIPSTWGDFSFTVTATSATGCAGSRNYELIVTRPCPTITLLPATLPSGRVNEAFAETLSAQGAVPPLVFGVSSGALPEGITLSAAGVLSGVPSAAGTSAFTIAVTDSFQCPGSLAYALEILPVCTPIAIAPRYLPSGVAGVAFDQTLTASGGRPPYTWSLASGTLPSGLTLDPATGRLQGTPAVADTFPIVVAASDTIGCSETRPYLLAIFATPPVSSIAADASGLMISNTRPCVGVPVKYTRGESAAVRSVRVTFALESTRLALCTPGTPGASIHPGAWLSGHPEAVLSTTDAGDGSYDVALELAGEPCGIDSGGTLFTIDAAAPGPDGSGTITVLAVQVRDCSGALVPVVPGPPAALAINRQPLTLQPVALPGGAVGVPYAVALATDSGTPPFTWTVDSGPLPAGLTLEAGSGALGGTPGETGTSYFSVSAADVNGRTGTRSYSISIFASPPASIVSAVTDGGCITSAHLQTTVPFVYERVDSAAVRAVSVTFQIETSKVALVTPANPSASIHEGSWFSGQSSVLFVTNNGGGSYTVDASIIGAECGPTTGGEIFTVDLAPVGADGEAQIAVLAVRVRDCANEAIPVAAGAASLLTIDRAGPPAVADLAAEAVLVTGSSDSTTRIRVAWSPGPGGQVDLYRAPRGTYPLYADATPPPDSSLVPGGPWVHVATNPAPGFVDLPAVRGVWDYVAVTTDSCGVSAISSTTRGTLDYLLGDVSNGIVPGTGDNTVGTVDISLLGTYYGLTGSSAVDPVGYLDVGPTQSGMPDSPPLPDHRIDLEDLMIFSLNYGASAGTPAPQRPARVARAAAPLATAPERFVVIAPAQVDAGTEVTAALRLTAGGRLHGFSARLAWDATVVEPIGVEPSGFIEPQGGVVLTPQPGTVDAALLGAGRGGISGEGEVARVRFRVLRAGRSGIALGPVDGRDAANRRIEILQTTGVALAAPTRTLLLAPTPNPAPGAAMLAYALARAGAVTLGVYDVQGRCVRTLVSAVQEAGAYQVRWDGRDDGGRAPSRTQPGSHPRSSASRSRARRILPLALRGIASTTRTEHGVSGEGRRGRSRRSTSPASGAAPGAGATAMTRAPWRATAAASAIPGARYSSRSSSAGYTRPSARSIAASTRSTYVT